MKIDHNAENVAMRDRSGNVRLNDPFVALFYDLLKLGAPPPQDLETLVREACASADASNVVYTNGFLANYALDIVRRLRIATETHAFEEALERAYWEFDNLNQGAVKRDMTLSERDAFKGTVRKLVRGGF